jgi:coenzyme Q-binding protein COQ10
MARHEERRMIPFPREFVFDLVADVESYPTFLPAWREARVYKREEGAYYTEQVIGRGPVRERFRSRTTLCRPESIVVSSSETRFRNFEIHWRFDAADDEQCRVHFTLEAESKSRILQGVLDVMLHEMARSIVQSFEDRARVMYKKREG